MQLQLRCIRSQSHVLNNLGGNIFQLLQVDTRPIIGLTSEEFK